MTVLSDQPQTKTRVARSARLTDDRYECFCHLRAAGHPNWLAALAAGVVSPNKTPKSVQDRIATLEARHAAFRDAPTPLDWEPKEQLDVLKKQYEKKVKRVENAKAKAIAPPRIPRTLKTKLVPPPISKYNKRSSLPMPEEVPE